MQLPRNEVLEKSRIYHKGNLGTLTNYQETINKAAYELCLENPNLMNNKGEVLNLSRAKVDEEGYVYKKKRSRSKVFGAVKEQVGEDIKKIKLSAEFRHNRIQDLSEDINSMNTTMALLEKERYKQHNLNKYAQAASLEEQIASKRKEKRALEEELTKLQEKEAKSKRYHMGKDSKGKDSKDKKETQGKTHNVQTKSGIQLSLFKSGIKPVHSKSNEIKDCSKSGEKCGAAENTESEKDDIIITAQVEETTRNNSAPGNDETRETSVSETMTCDTESVSGDHFL